MGISPRMQSHPDRLIDRRMMIVGPTNGMNASPACLRPRRLPTTYAGIDATTHRTIGNRRKSSGAPILPTDSR